MVGINRNRGDKVTNEEFQHLVLEKLTSLEQGQVKLEQRQANLEQRQKILETKVDNGQSNLAACLENVTASKEALIHIEKKIDKIMETQVIQGESINILALRQLKAESEIETLKKAR